MCKIMFDTRRLLTLSSAVGEACLGCHVKTELTMSTYDITVHLETNHHPVSSLHKFDLEFESSSTETLRLLWSVVSRWCTLK